jgi:iron complex outermembrane receptor protein
MVRGNNRIQSRLLAGASIAALAIMPVSAFAQSSAMPEDEDGETPEANVPVVNGDGIINGEGIIVTGSLIRGTEAVGTQTISVDDEAIVQLGANSTNQILSLIPQIANTFNGRFEADPRGTRAGISITKPNLRSLPSFNSSSGGTTLVLVDGFRLTPVGVGQASIDVDIVPGNILAGVDVLTDGGTSLYGADAVAGVINFRTMREFDGLKMDVNYGLGDTLSGYDQYDASVTAGTSWDSGNAYLSFAYAYRDEILNNEVPWAGGEFFEDDGTPTFGGTQCPNPVGTETRWFNFGAGFTNNPAAPGAGTFAVGEPCDDFGPTSYLPEQERFNVFGSIVQELGDAELRVTAYYTKRDQALSNPPRGFTTAGSGITSGQALLAAFPEAANTPRGRTFAVTEGVGFSFEQNPAYVDTDVEVGFETYGITPELTFGLTSDFQARVTAHFGRSDNFQRFPGVDELLAQQLVNSGALDPFDVASASAETIEAVTDFETAQDTKHQLFVVRAVVDGPLFPLPGGDARIAVGAEYQNSQVDLRSFSGNVDAIDNRPFREASQNVKALFAELNFPIVDQFTLLASARYDDYSDFGDTFNPNIGFSFTPVEGFEIFGHWNTSFNAPTALDQLAEGVGRFTPPIYTTQNGPNDPFNEWDGTGTRSFILDGAKAGLEPQEAESWVVGVEFSPINNLRIGGQYYYIDFTNILGAVNPAEATSFINNPEFYYYSPTQELYSQFLSELANGDVIAAQLPVDDIALIVDRRVANLSSAILEGVDFHAYLDVPASFADLSFGVNGNIPMTIDVETSGNVVDQLPEVSEFTASIFGSLRTGGFTSRVTVNYSGRIDDNGPDFQGNTISIPPFVQTNLFFGYEFGEDSGALKGTSLRLIVDNLFEEEPTRTMRGDRNTLGYTRWTLGRVFKFGITKQF